MNPAPPIVALVLGLCAAEAVAGQVEPSGIGASRAEERGAGSERAGARDAAPAASADAARNAARVEAARAALAAGDLASFVHELDLVLGADPDHAAARALVGRAPIALTLPAGAERALERRLVLFGARAQPAYRELAAARLAAEPRERVVAELARALSSPSPNVRAFAAFALRRVDARAQADALVRRAVVDPFEPARVEAARALRDCRDEALVLRVAAALSHDDARLRAHAAAALGEIGHAAALAPLRARLAAVQAGGHPGGTRAHLAITNQVAYVQDYAPQIAQGASIADLVVDIVTEGTVLDVRAVTSPPRPPDERRGLTAALRRLGG